MKKRILQIFMALMVAAAPFLVMPPTEAVLGPNLVANPSVETASPTDSTKPQSWSTGTWGTNTSTKTYVTNDGRTGTKSVRTDTTAYTNGDIKWFFAPVNVTAGSSYTVSAYYKSNVTSDVVAEITKADGSVAYQWLTTVAPSASAWTQYSTTLVAPAQAKTVTIMQVYHQVGWMQIDDVYMGLTDDGSGPAPTTYPNIGTNYLSNPSMETAGGTVPANWQSNNWGTNTAKFTYETTGAQNGSRSVKTTVSGYTNGDAKWFFSPVNVKASTPYSYTHYYKSTAATEIVAAFIDASGNYTYQSLQTIPASSSWLPVTVNVSTPANVKQMTILHVIAANGSLQIDNASLVETAVSTNPIPNPSVETASGTGPAGWQNGKWGTNTAKFEYVSGGAHTGNKSLKVTVSNYTDGDAKWMYTPTTALTPGKSYRFSMWYKTNTIPKVVAQYNMSDGTTKFFGMPNPEPKKGFLGLPIWQEYSDTFTVPVGAVSVTTFMFLDRNGYVQTDDFSIKEYTPTAYSRPLVTLTFDDGHEDNVANALPLMNQYGIKSTQCYATDHVEGDATAIAGVKAFFNAGHEICSHTVSHPFLTKITSTQLTTELQHSQKVLQNIIGQPVRNFASPYGDYNATVNTAIAKYYQSHRTVDEGYNSKDNFNPYRLRVQNVQSNTSMAEFQSWLDHAARTNTWLILVYHRVADDPGQFDTYKTDFVKHLDALKKSGLTVKTYQAALDEVKVQK